MGAYETLAGRPRLTNLLTAVIIAVAIGFIVHDVRRTRAAGSALRAYYTTDDGRTYFADDAGRLPPFDSGGKPAVRAYVYACDGQPFVVYLERYTPEGLASISRLDAGGKVPLDRDLVATESCEVKRPGDGAWVKRASDAGRQIVEVTCPGRADAVPRFLSPGE